MNELNNKVAVVTGGASGIGKAIVEKFLVAGAVVHVLELDGVKETGQVERSSDHESKVHIHSCDVSKSTDVMTTIDTIAARSSIDILVNNAGIAHVGNLEDTNEEDLDRLYEVNVKGVYNCMKAVVPFMKQNGAGCILNMASIASSVAVADRFAYSMTKGAVLTMTYSVAKDYLKDRIRCNCISPARVHTPFVDGFIKNNYPGEENEMFEKLSASQPIGRMGRPEEVAELALFLCSDKAAFMTGTDYPIDGGFIKLNG